MLKRSLYVRSGLHLIPWPVQELEGFGKFITLWSLDLLYIPWILASPATEATVVSHIVKKPQMHCCTNSHVLTAMLPGNRHPLKKGGVTFE